MTDPILPGQPATDEALYREILTSIVKRFVRLVGVQAALHGELKVDSSPGKGTQLNFRIPLQRVRTIPDDGSTVIGSRLSA